MTSRTGPGGLQGRLGITPDLTTLGKYIGGGSSFGAFGGRADVMALFDPARPGALPHAGTFNNNVASMAAGHAGLTKVYPPEVAERHTARGDALREELAQTFRAAGAPFQVTGVGSLLAVHATAAPVRTRGDLSRSDPRLLELLFLDLLELGYYIAPRGYLALSLALTSGQLAGFVAAVGKVLDARAALWAPPGGRAQHPGNAAAAASLQAGWGHAAVPFRATIVTPGGPAEVLAAKAALRQEVWSAMRDGQGGPVPRRGRPHPELHRRGGGRRAAPRHPRCGRPPSTVKANPDSAQLPVRQRALEDGKTVYMAVPRLAEPEPFFALDPAHLSRAAAQGGLDQRRVPVRPAGHAGGPVPGRPGGDGQRRGRRGRRPAGQGRRVRRPGVRPRRGGGPDRAAHRVCVTTVHELQVRASRDDPADQPRRAGGLRRHAGARHRLPRPARAAAGRRASAGTT